MAVQELQADRDRTAWNPVACSAELRAGDNIVAGFAHSVELALWRSADGVAQAWENRCPHRSVRLTLGQIVGNRLSCAYHGWQYAAGSGQCVGIPAHPAMPAPRSVCAKVYPVAEAAGMIWVDLEPPQGEAGAAPGTPPPAAAVPAGWIFCRTLGLRAGIDSVRAALAQRRFAAVGASAWHGTLAGVPVIALLLDAQPHLTFAHLWTEAAPRSAVLREVHRAARRLRGDIETPAP